ncbi:nicotinamide riboside transporter PnuC [Kriegella aquimaris]|uniref:Nicotinamide riboside transporter PnuC n=1 Tax=Kriegella aquimaris TaxID=192904 RepID=A0A1G9M3Z0_9FLAO|nr:nicotinamide riboside transporter PnuC [Kriegella aquimaris]SDL68926.1 nicotinamide mononucleotide transporter [Kriegella aquimaris]
MNLAFEIIGTILSLAFLYFLIREKKICWLFGILGSLLSIYLFYSTKLYSECILRLYYVFIGFYGYYLWQQRDHHDKGAPKIIKWKPSIHVIIVLVGLVLVFLLGYVFDNYSDAKKSYFDAFTTVFSFLASYLEAKKILRTWVYWIILNGLSIFLYAGQGLFVYAALAVIYFGVSFYGYFSWKQKYNKLNTVVNLVHLP